MASITTRREKGFIWIPPEDTAAWKLVVVRSDGTEDDITSIISSLEIEDGVTESIGRFSFEIWNPNGTYTDVWKAMDKVYFYSDRAADATTVRFLGRIGKVSYRGLKLQVTGNSDAVRLLNVTVTKQYEESTASDVLTDLISNYGSGYTSTEVGSETETSQTMGIFTVTLVDATTETVTANWYQTPFWDCVEELCKAVDYDCYVDGDSDFNFFKRGSRENFVEGISHQHNLLSVGDYAKDSTQIINRVIVYGVSQDGIQIIYTAEDSDSQIENDRISETIINDNDITSYEQAKAYGDSKLAELKEAPLMGEITAVFLGTLQPGESIPLSSPADNITPGIYNVISYKHKLGERDFSTSIRLTKEPRKSTHIMKSIIAKQNKLQETSINPHEMRHSFNFLFDDEEGTHNHTEITGGVLKLDGSVGTGDWESPVRNHGVNVIEAYLILNGETLTGATIEVSNDNGITYSTITNKEKIIFTTIGSNIRIKVSINNLDTQIDSLSILYKT